MIKQGFKEDGQEGDLFEGAGDYYARYRRPYPPQVVSYIVDEFRLNGHGRLLDGGCGTGQVFSVLGQYFEEVVAFDSDAHMVEKASQLAQDRHLTSVKVIQMKGEDINSNLGEFRLATFGASFHWMDRATVADLVFERLELEGHLVLLAPSGLHSGKAEWEIRTREVIANWLGSQRRAG